jgi:hypothetical protein
VSSIPARVRSAGLIFSGTVVERGKSTVPEVPDSPELVVVRVDRGLRVDRVHGDLSGRLITVAPLSSEHLEPGAKAVFFTNSWIHGRGIAVREVAHVDVEEEGRVARAVSELPRMHLLDRMQAAELVVEAEVVDVKKLGRLTLIRDDALWAAAELRVSQVLRGAQQTEVTVYFPTSDHPAWASAPRFRRRQRGVFILHKPDRNDISQAALPPEALVVLDPADYQPHAQLQAVQKLLAALE